MNKRILISIWIICIVALLWGLLFFKLDKHTDWISYTEGFVMALLGCYLGWWCSDE